MATRVTFGARVWKEVSEPNHTYQCPDHCALVGRKHVGDENANTIYSYAPLEAAGGVIHTVSRTWSKKEPESVHSWVPLEHWFYAEDGYVVVGREHTGDENGLTQYETAKLIYIPNDGSAQRPVRTVRSKSDPGFAYESNHDFACDPNWIMTGRFHEGDENGPTKYRQSWIEVA